MIANPEKTAEHIVGLHMENQAMKDSRVNASMSAAHRDHGRDFEQAYSNLMSLDSNDPAARGLVQKIYAHADPGAALMEWHEISGGRAGAFMGGRGGGTARSGRIMPSLNSGTPASYRQPSGRSGRSDGWPVGEDDGGYADNETERDIMASAFR